MCAESVYYHTQCVQRVCITIHSVCRECVLHSVCRECVLPYTVCAESVYYHTQCVQRVCITLYLKLTAKFELLLIMLNKSFYVRVLTLYGSDRHRSNSLKPT